MGKSETELCDMKAERKKISLLFVFCLEKRITT